MRTGPHPSDLSAAWKVRRYLRKFGPFDAIHGHSSKGGAIARVAAFGTGVPAFYTLHGLIMMDPGLARWKRLLYMTIELGLSLRTAPDHRRLARGGPGGRPARPRPVARRHRPQRRRRARPRPAPRGPPRHRRGRRRDRDRLRRPARRAEGPARVDRGVRRHRSEPPRRRGSPWSAPARWRARCANWPTRLGVAEKIVWLGERDARGVLAGFDLFALSSRKEGLPYVVLEAMAAGLPVVATASAGVEILIEPGVTGEIVPRDDAAAFAAALTGLSPTPAASPANPPRRASGRRCSPSRRWSSARSAPTMRRPPNPKPTRKTPKTSPCRRERPETHIHPGDPRAAGGSKT